MTQRFPSVYAPLARYFVPQPTPIYGAQTIQILIMRQTLDDATFRTEESGEINSAVVPSSSEDPSPTMRAAFLASKQRAVETRTLERLLRTAVEAQRDTPSFPFADVPACYHKNHLCMHCPRCLLYGATSMKSGEEQRNIKHRLHHATAYSLLPYNEVVSGITFNGIDDVTQTTGQAFNTRFVVKAQTIFASIVTLQAVTWHEFVLTLKTLLAARAYGAGTRISGDMRNTIVGIVAGWEAVITPLELTAQLASAATKRHVNAVAMDGQAIANIATEFKSMAGTSNAVTVCTPDQVEAIVQAASDQALDAPFLTAAYTDAYAFFK